MINILLIDDNPIKVSQLRDLVNSIHGEVSLDIATDLVGGRNYMSKKCYDLLVLDLNIPNRFGDDPLPKNGIDFLKEINRSERLVKPYHIIGLTAYENNITEYVSDFEIDLWALIKYEQASDSWSKKIRNKINYLITSKKSMQSSQIKEYEFDLAIITALRITELDSVLNLGAFWESVYINNDSTEYHLGYFQNENKRINVVAAAAPQMGMVAASVLTMKLIQNFRPKFLVMSGIAGGCKGQGNLGDILFTELSFDSGSGKIKTNKEGDAIFEPDYKSIHIETDMRELAISCKGTREFLDAIKKKWQADAPISELNLHIGPLASGAGVVENRKIIEEIKGHSRKLIGIDMETYGVFYAAQNCSKPRPLSVLSIKSISDFADPEKNDSFQKYAAYTSANFIYNFFLNKVPFS